MFGFIRELRVRYFFAGLIIYLYMLHDNEGNIYEERLIMYRMGTNVYIDSYKKHREGERVSLCECPLRIGWPRHFFRFGNGK